MRDLLRSDVQGAGGPLVRVQDLPGQGPSLREALRAGMVGVRQVSVNPKLEQPQPHRGAAKCISPLFHEAVLRGVALRKKDAHTNQAESA